MKNLGRGGSSFYSVNGNCFYGVCVSVGANKLVGGHCDY